LKVVYVVISEKRIIPLGGIWSFTKASIAYPSVNKTKPAVQAGKDPETNGPKDKRVCFCDPGAARTRDKLIKSQLLCQLSYGALHFARLHLKSID
jgi:hypothetical protein